RGGAAVALVAARIVLHAAAGAPGHIAAREGKARRAGPAIGGENGTRPALAHGSLVRGAGRASGLVSPSIGTLMRHRPGRIVAACGKASIPASRARRRAREADAGGR